jgi:desulfoferrodoxin-like iron-binding protein
MAVKQLDEIYRCNVCGNVVSVIKVGGGTLVCCGKDMEKIDSGSYEQVTRSLPDSGDG